MIKLPASLTIDTVERFAAEIVVAAEPGVFTVDAAALERLTSPGIQILLSLHKTVRRGGGRLYLHSLSSTMAAILTQSGLAELAGQWTQPTHSNPAEK